jgi:FlaA1/EpsC-like NDP-sugar epimerase
MGAPARVVFLVYGPVLILPPKRKVAVTSAVARAVVQTGQAKPTRWGALCVFVLVCAAQVFVAYALYQVLTRILAADLTTVLGLVGCYVLVVVVYLLAFYCTMARASVVIQGIDLLTTVRARVRLWAPTLRLSPAPRQPHCPCATHAQSVAACS